MNPAAYKDVFELLKIIIKASGFGQIIGENYNRTAKFWLRITYGRRTLLFFMSTDLFWSAVKAYQTGNLMVVVVNGEKSFTD